MASLPESKQQHSGCSALILLGLFLGAGGLVTFVSEAEYTDAARTLTRESVRQRPVAPVPPAGLPPGLTSAPFEVYRPAVDGFRVSSKVMPFPMNKLLVVPLKTKLRVYFDYDDSIHGLWFGEDAQVRIGREIVRSTPSVTERSWGSQIKLFEITINLSGLPTASRKSSEPQAPDLTRAVGPPNLRVDLSLDPNLLHQKADVRASMKITAPEQIDRGILFKEVSHVLERTFQIYPVSDEELQYLQRVKSYEEAIRSHELAEKENQSAAAQARKELPAKMERLRYQSWAGSAAILIALPLLIIQACRLFQGSPQRKTVA